MNHDSESAVATAPAGKAVSRRSDLPGAKLHLSFNNGKDEQVVLVTPPIGSSYTPRVGDTAEIAAANAYRAAVHDHQTHNSVTARVGLLLQNTGAVTAEDVLITVTIPAGLQMAFVEQEPPPKSVRKTPVVPLEPSPRAWRADSETSAHCRVARVTSSVGLPQLFLTLRDPKGFAAYELKVKMTAVTPPVEDQSRLTVRFAEAQVPQPG